MPPTHSAAGQRADLAFAGPRKPERLERLQHAAQRGMRTLRALRDERDAAVVARKHVDDQTRLTIRIAMQHEAGLLGDAEIGADVAARAGGRRLQAASAPRRRFFGAAARGWARVEGAVGYASNRIVRVQRHPRVIRTHTHEVLLRCRPSRSSP